jgi:tetratricopeptide (TPR) repeat protein
MTAKLTGALRESPATVPALAAIALFVVWVANQAGYPQTHWAPGGLVVLALLGMTIWLVAQRLEEIPLAVRVALGALAAYTVLSFLSIAWAAVPGDAWEGANRTLLYLLVFALFACWRRRGAGALLLVGAWTLALIVLAAIDALHLSSASSASLQQMLPGGRLQYPSGYPNANAAQWLMAFWPAVLLARSERVAWPIRGLLAGGAVLLAEMALFSQSRGSLYATPVMAILVFALVGARTRTYVLLVAVGAGVAAAAPAVLRVGNHLHAGLVSVSAVHSAVTGAFIAAAVVAIVVALGALLESRLELSGASRGRIRSVVAVIAILTLIGGVAGGLAVGGNPITRVEHAWRSFKGGYSEGPSSGSHLASGLGSNRYDFYRVAIDEFLAHPVLGIGADNFQQQYLARGRSDETPRYPHSVELRTLTQTGLLGALLALVGLLAALVAGASALRDTDPLVRTVAAAALAGFAYWVLHGSFDWFWEFAGLGAPAFAMLGIACALAPARAVAFEETRTSAPAWRRRGLLGVGSIAALAAAISLAAPWLSQLQVESAARVWTKAPQTAYARLRQAAKLNPLSDEAYLVAGSIALRYGETAYAEHQFTLALSRTSGDAYATLELGAIASADGRRAAALRLLRRAVALDPGDTLAREALGVARIGRRIDLDELNRSILLKAQQLA